LYYFSRDFKNCVNLLKISFFIKFGNYWIFVIYFFSGRQTYDSFKFRLPMNLFSSGHVWSFAGFGMKILLKIQISLYNKKAQLFQWLLDCFIFSLLSRLLWSIIYFTYSGLYSGSCTSVNYIMSSVIWKNRYVLITMTNFKSKKSVENFRGIF